MDLLICQVGLCVDIIFVFENYPIDESTHNRSIGFSITGVRGIEKTEYPLTVVL